MKITKIFILIIGVILLILSFYRKNMSIGALWKSYHANSLIGIQKIIESNELLNQLNIDIWFNIIVPILRLELIFILSLVFLLISFFLYRK